MANMMEKGKEGLKMLGTASVQMMIGGLVAAIVPPHVSMVYKAAAYVGSCVVAMCISDPVDKVVDKQVETIQAVVDQTKQYVDILQQQEVKESVEE